MSNNGYKVAAKAAGTEFTEKKSRFITYVECVSTPAEAEAFFAAVRAKHPDARHVCCACRTHTPFFEKCGDDGEPQGTAGRPMLGVLQKEDVYDIAVAVVRYFGGILLGTGGLSRAYTRGCADGVAAAGVMVMRRAVPMRMSVSYRYAEAIEKCIGRFSGRTEETEFAEKVGITCLIPQENADAFRRAILDLTAGETAPESGAPVLCKMDAPADF